MANVKPCGVSVCPQGKEGGTQGIDSCAYNQCAQSPASEDDLLFTVRTYGKHCPFRRTVEKKITKQLQQS